MQKTLVCIFIVLIGLASYAHGSEVDRVLMEEGEIQVTEKDLKLYIQAQIPEKDRAQALSRPGALAKMMENLFVIRHLAAKADQYDSIDRDEIQWKVDLEKDRLKMRAVMSAEVRDVLEDTDLESAAREAYIAGSDDFKAPERVEVSHILIATEERTDEEALELAENLRQRLREGASFSDLATEYSDDPLVEDNQGRLEPTARGKMVPAFEKAAFALEEPGSLSEPVKTRYGYHLILLHEHHPETRKDFEEVRDQLMNKRRALISERVRGEILMESRSADDATVDWDLVEELEKQYREQETVPTAE